jgi:hypothetical protein
MLLDARNAALVQREVGLKHRIAQQPDRETSIAFNQ